MSDKGTRSTRVKTTQHLQSELRARHTAEPASLLSERLTSDESTTQELKSQPPTDRGDPDQWVTLARLVRPQGRKGELLAEILTDFPERFSERRRLFLRNPKAAGRGAMGATREVALEAHWRHKDRLVLKFAGIDSINDAEAFREYEVVIPYAERAPLEDGAVYIGDLVGCVLYDRAAGRIVGEIVDVDRESANMELLVVRPSGELGGEILIPFANAYEPHMDLKGRRMDMTLPEGLLQLDAPLTAEEREALAAEQTIPGEGQPVHETARKKRK